MGDAVTKRVVVHGDVQGVFFRDSARKEARARGVSGWVRNRSDGAVEAVFQGPADVVDAMIEWCRSGPSRAHVDDMDVSLEPGTDSFDGFEVR